ncbi:hypothetical protein F5B22DRAFT_619083 [Xylaria bambusicola]|uniref:uncharacterized protein n=1 Tax=Xylaria bambusicola TaxID=326684 RepID=UPI002007CAEB|nr:uncharacterized protein F5B22DRAFT_619083 [Xylaria bambusicola]KAI0508887.1 hypothetical protein F5B22DRAFT_619083 [Xylaria bambusicola]
MEGAQRPKTDQRRRRPTLACVSCRKSKIRCDRKHPCGACVRGRHKTCVFEDTARSTARRSGIASTAADPAGTAETERRGPVTPASSASTALNHDHVSPVPGSDSGNQPAPLLDVGALLKRCFELERRLEESTAAKEPPERRDQQSPSPEGPAIDCYLAVDIHSMSRGVFSKTRCFGQSHWMNIIVHFKSMLELFEHQSRDAKSEAVAVLNRCKALGRSIKAQRYPGIINKFGTKMPTRDIADRLVDGYLRSIETIFRVLHVPTFKRDYERYWAAPDTVGLSFVIQLQLVMAIGCTLYDDSFSMRNSAVQWVIEAQYWLLGPPAKGKLTITGLQIMALLTIARETASVGGDLVWIHVGSLLRSAFCMGLHRDPSRLPKMSRLDAEIRRRLWNTILELELKTSADAGGFPTISPETSDTRAPANLDDTDLMKDDESSDPEAGDRFTDMSIPLALRDSFRDRLAIYQWLNATPFRGTYEDTIQLHRRFMTSFKGLMKRLKSYPHSGRQPTAFQCRFIEIMARRCLIGLHLPWFGAGLREPAFSFSRKEVIESAVKSYHLIFPSSATNLSSTTPLVNSGADLETLSTEGNDLARFAVCGAGIWRLVASQASMIILLELQTTLQEDDSIGPPTPRPDLLNIIRHSLPLYLSRIKAGETNVKGYLFGVALAAYVQALMDGLDGPKTTEPILSAAKKTEKICFDLLKQQLASAEYANSNGSENQFDWDSLMTTDEEWTDHSMMGAFFEVSSVEGFLGSNLGFDFMSPPMPF